jgi:chromosomal replication initiation ATPase DnaA
MKTSKSSYYALPVSDPEHPETIAVHNIKTYIMDFYRLSWEEIISPTRKREICFVRQLLIFLLKKRTGLKDWRIAEIVNRERSTISREIYTIQDYIDTDSLNKREEILLHLSALSMSA